MKRAEVHEIASWAPFGVDDVANGEVDITVSATAGNDAFSVRLMAPFSRAAETLSLGQVTVTEGPTASGALAGASVELATLGPCVAVSFGAGTDAETTVTVTLSGSDGQP